jgi:hypothetical protein
LLYCRILNELPYSMEDLMKTALKLITAILLTGALSAAHAQVPAAPPASPSPQAMPHGPMMGGTQDIQAAMKKMQDEMAKIRSTSDLAERQKLLTQHMSTMQEAMGAMMNMGSPSTGNEPRLGMMEQRMGMMQMMMQQMMQHQDMMERRQ